MPIVPADLQNPGSKNASMPFGEPTQTQRDIRSVQSAGGGQGNFQDRAGGIPNMPGAGQQQPPVVMGQPTAPMGLTGEPVQPTPVDQRMNPDQIFQNQMIFNPTSDGWKEQARQWASHPNAGPELYALGLEADKVQGPLDKMGRRE